MTARRTTILGCVALAASLSLGFGIRSMGNGPLALDTWWADAVAGSRDVAGDAVAYTLNVVGGGWVAYALGLASIAALLVLRRPWAAVYIGLVVAVGAVSVELLKELFGRPRPDGALLLFESGALPSGHSSNAAALVVALALLIGRRWPWPVAFVYVTAMMISRTYLGVHWLTDTVSGLGLGAGLALVFWAVFAPLAHRDRPRRPTSVEP